jgi:hypothetical protein
MKWAMGEEEIKEETRKDLGKKMGDREREDMGIIGHQKEKKGSEEESLKQIGIDQ